MSFVPRTLVVATALSATLLTAAACGSSGGGSSSGGSGTGSSTSGSPGSSASGSQGADSAVSKLVPAAIAKKGTLSFAMDASYPPDEYFDTDGSTIIGLDADLAKDLASTMGLKASLQNVTFDNIIPGLQSGKYDIGLSSFTDTKEREKVVDFVTYFQAGEGFYVKAGSGKTFDGLASLCGHTVSVETGTVEKDDADAQAKKCSVKVLTFGKQTDANLAVSSGRADVGFADSQVAENIVKQSHGQFESTGKAFTVAPYGIALPKNNGMAKAVQAALKALIANGTYSSLLSKWGVTDGAVTSPVVNGAQS